MSLDFSNVKSITIPEGEVKEIRDSNDNILWSGSHIITVNAPNCTVVGSGEFDDGYSYTVTITCQGQRYIDSATSGGTKSSSITINSTSQSSTEYQVITYTGTLTDDITINVTTANYYVISFVNNYDSSQNQTKNWAYSSTPSYSGTPTRSADSTYTYSFAGWTPSVVVATENKTYTTTWNSTYINYTITWRWQSSYGSWTTTTETYHYNATPSRTLPSNVISGNNRQVCTGWDSLAKVTASRTINAVYKQQYYATISGTRCSANISTGWYDSGTTITWTANSYCAFDSTGTTTTQTASITSGTSYSKSADYIYVTISGTRCSANYSTDWHPYNRKVTWTADTAYAFDTVYNTTTSTANLTSPGGSYSKSADYVKRYTLTISVTGSYGGYSVSRTSSPYQRASTGELSSGSTIYYGDVLSGSSSSGVQYGAWDCTPDDLTLPTGSWNGGATTSPSISLTARNTATANLYRRPSWSSDWTHLSSNWGINATTSLTDTGLAFDTTYYYHVARNQNRNYWVWSPSSSNYTGTNGVTGSVTASFTFTKGGTQTESNWIGGGETPISTGSQATYTITWKYMQSYDNWTTATETYNYGATPSRSDPGTKTSGNMRYRSDSWDNTSAVTSNRTITRNYTQQAYISFSLSHCTSNVASGWQNVGTTITYTSTDGWAFDNSGTRTTTGSVTSGGTYYYSASYYYLKLVGTNCISNKANGWYTGTTTVTWTANEYYLMSNNNSKTYTRSYSVAGTYYRSANVIGSSQFSYGSYGGSNDHQLKRWSEYDYDSGDTYYYTGLYLYNGSGYTVDAYISFAGSYSTGSGRINNNSSTLFAVDNTVGYIYPTWATVYLMKTGTWTEINRFTIYFGSSC